VSEEIQKERKLICVPTEPTIKDLCSRIDKGKLDTRAKFQRRYVWENKITLKSRLIESVLLKIPIPTIYTAELPDGTEEVIDGQQRLSTFHSFLQNEFELKKLEILTELNGMKYSDLSQLPKDYQSELDNYGIRVIKILKESDPEVKFDIFERLNRGSVILKEQELRNCIYRGNLNDLLIKLTDNKLFLKMQNLPEPHRRMQDAERILRFFAFCDMSERKYKSPLKTFLNTYMEAHRNLSTKEIETKEQQFKKSLEICEFVFRDMAFKRWHNGVSKENPNGYAEYDMNEGIFDIQMYGFMEYEKRQIVNRAEAIRDAFLDLCCDTIFIATVEKGTYDTTQVKTRTDMWFSKLREVIGYPEHDRRLYNYEEKDRLFKEVNGICQICKGKINDITNADVDHKKRFAEDGKTTIENGQIAHRYCNLAKN
jgi:hypothetical protein